MRKPLFLLSEKDFPELKNLLASQGLPFETGAVKDSQFWGIRDGERLVGSVGLTVQNEIALLRSLAVSNSHQKKGLGSQLVDEAIGKATQEFVEKIFLITDSAESFFSRHHFANIPRSDAPLFIQSHPQFTELCPDSAVVMARTVKQPQRSNSHD